MGYVGSPSPSTSPDEEVVRRRGRRIIPAGNQFALTPPRTPTKRQQSPKGSSSSEHPQTPSKSQLMMSPVRSSPRKRLLLPADISEAVNASPSKKLVSPVKRLRLQSREAEAETEVALTALTKPQLVALLKDTMSRNAAAKQHKCLQRGQQLCQAEQWSSLLEYAQQAWNFVRKMPEWQDSSHNKARLVCLRTLATHCTTALKKMTLDQRQLETLISRLKEMKDDSPCVTAPLKLAEAQLEQCLQ
ncbi:hypothetical protein HPB50_027311 [Hyalomma asiaticum]|uniref:Uncharacterized protein n=1 Tax=Hyalomma asiaticum TaxID=266040 RepID=A0ACB7SG86_HYAAI|nr:hypothetical protein HPB50_027311 [Hyalomma asiaticum]